MKAKKQKEGYVSRTCHDGRYFEVFLLSLIFRSETLFSSWIEGEP